MSHGYFFGRSPKITCGWLLALALLSACNNKTDETPLIIQKSGSTITFHMSAVSQPFDKACFVDSEYDQFYFGDKNLSLSGFTPANISRRSYKYLEKGYSPQYLLMVLKNGDSYEAIPIYGPKIDGIHSRRFNSNTLSGSIQVERYRSPRSCTEDKQAVARCVKLGGSSCYMFFDEER